MSRDWVKVHCCILKDPNINGLSPESGWNWTRMLTLAGDNEDGGRIGDVQTVAYVLRVAESSILQTVSDLGGRIVERGGQLWFRDWAEWQSASNRERQAAFKAGLRNAPDGPVTTGNEQKQPVTSGNASNASRVRARPDQTRPEETRQEPTPLTPLPDQPEGAGVAAVAIADAGASAGAVSGNGHKAQPQPRAAPADRKWAPFEEAVSKALGGIRVVQARNGRPLAWVGELCSVAGQNAGGDVKRAVALWDSFVGSEEWRYRPRDPAGLPAAFGAWAASHREDGTPRHRPGRATEDPSWRVDRIISEEEHQEQIARCRALGLMR